MRIAGAAHVADLDTLENLRELDLTYNAIGRKGFAALAASGTLSGLRRLSLANNERLGGGALDTLRRGCPWPELKSLDLSCCKLDDEDARRLSRWSGLAPLKILRLGSNHLGDSGLDAMLGAARDLRVLYLDSNCGGTGIAEAMALVEERLGRAEEMRLRPENPVQRDRVQHMLSQGLVAALRSGDEALMNRGRVIAEKTLEWVPEPDHGELLWSLAPARGGNPAPPGGGRGRALAAPICRTARWRAGCCTPSSWGSRSAGWCRSRARW